MPSWEGSWEHLRRASATRTSILAAIRLDADAPRRPWPWRAWLIYTHRWLGIVGGLLFIAWFASGIVMMYARMPTVTLDEHACARRAARRVVASVTPFEAATTAKAPSGSAELGMLRGRPVYRFRGRTARAVFADDGSMIERSR